MHFKGLYANVLFTIFQPISSISEYCQKKQLDLVFTEVPVERSTMFGNQCSIGGTLYQIGVGRSKKDAKIDAAKKAFTAIIGESYSEPG